MVKKPEVCVLCGAPAGLKWRGNWMCNKDIGEAIADVVHGRDVVIYMGRKMTSAQALRLERAIHDGG